MESYKSLMRFPYVRTCMVPLVVDETNNWIRTLQHQNVVRKGVPFSSIRSPDKVVLTDGKGVVAAACFPRVSRRRNSHLVVYWYINGCLVCAMKFIKTASTPIPSTRKDSLGCKLKFEGRWRPSASYGLPLAHRYESLADLQMEWGLISNLIHQGRVDGFLLSLEVWRVPAMPNWPPGVVHPCIVAKQLRK